MRASTFIAAALPLGISAMPAPAIIEDRGLISDLVCIPYNIVVNQILADFTGIKFCAQYIKVPSLTITSIVTSSAQAVTITAPITINGGGAVTVTNLATTTLQAGVAAPITSLVTVSVTVPTATTGVTCLNSAYSAPTIVKRDAEITEAPDARKGKHSTKSKSHKHKSSKTKHHHHTGVLREFEPVQTAAAPWKREEQPKLVARLLNLFGGLFGAPAPTPAPAPAPAPTPAPAPGPGPLGVPTPVTNGPIAGAVSTIGALNGVTVPRPAYIPAYYADGIISTLCNCAGIPTQTATVVSTSVIAAKTVTLAPTTTVNPGSKVTIVNTITITPAAAAGKTVTSTVTSTVGSVATSIAANGLVYQKFPSTFDGYSQNAGFGADTFHGKTPDFSGVWSTLNFATPYWPSMDVDFTLQLDKAAPFDVDMAALLFSGFFLAPQTGSYTFSVPAEYNDNFSEFWTGDAALSWADSGSAFKAIRTSNNSKGGSTTVKLNAGDAMPFAYLWANGGGAGRSAFNIVFPDGSSPSDFSKLFVQACSDNVFAH
ncbi:hypothetical protein Micbo1qcDRAFT_221595 [Microdochium bolleyi]|uniref:PA14 domain-containing protein n=1 Tax=Microdochium bolleyi TaxID=196109 RepID=A0A136IMA3_9PEZI|nr:hypothetical protein Micbo1qcDRAFT_221595 [Microdochium bolleyi]